ncbi:hypothetical protein GCM10007977_100710 [Dactylosporangium sucinum]|uniref:Uncharacterized protein n=1 Tax=Dactylosporangium sucinum TaxID=1424081 RepID=A0A917X5S7_9ACTN|nr:hypothetical protein GCM10007977_100710 [Dactylosporangium sucinum]
MYPAADCGGTSLGHHGHRGGRCSPTRRDLATRTCTYKPGGARYGRTVESSRDAGAGGAPGVTTPGGPKTTTAVPKKTTKPPAPKTTAPGGGGGPIVTPGAFCSPEGAIGYTSKGTKMRCTRKPGEDRARWRAA